MITKARTVGIAAAAALALAIPVASQAAASGTHPAATSASVSRSSSAKPRVLSRSATKQAEAAPASLPCGTSSAPDGSGGWLLTWYNCWGYNGVPIAPEWFNGVGDYYADVRDGSGNDICQYVKSGDYFTWDVTAAELPPESTKYVGIVYCLVN